MNAAEERTLTVGEAARRLHMSVDALLEMVYAGRLSATVSRSSGRLLLNDEDVDRVRAGTAGR